MTVIGKSYYLQSIHKKAHMKWAFAILIFKIRRSNGHRLRWCYRLHSRYGLDQTDDERLM